MRPWQKLLARAGHLRPLLLAHQSLPAPFPDAGLTTPEPNKSLKITFHPATLEPLALESGHG